MANRKRHGLDQAPVSTVFLIRYNSNIRRENSPRYDDYVKFLA
jgi:hypothetical protein